MSAAAANSSTSEASYSLPLTAAGLHGSLPLVRTSGHGNVFTRIKLRPIKGAPAVAQKVTTTTTDSCRVDLTAEEEPENKLVSPQSSQELQPPVRTDAVVAASLDDLKNARPRRAVTSAVPLTREKRYDAATFHAVMKRGKRVMSASASGPAGEDEIETDKDVPAQKKQKGEAGEAKDEEAEEEEEEGDDDGGDDKKDADYNPKEEADEEPSRDDEEDEEEEADEDDEEIKRDSELWGINLNEPHMKMVIYMQSGYHDRVRKLRPYTVISKRLFSATHGAYNEQIASAKRINTTPANSLVAEAFRSETQLLMNASVNTLCDFNEVYGGEYAKTDSEAEAEEEEEEEDHDAKEVEMELEKHLASAEEEDLKEREMTKTDEGVKELVESEAKEGKDEEKEKEKPAGEAVAEDEEEKKKDAASKEGTN